MKGELTKAQLKGSFPEDPGSKHLGKTHANWYSHEKIDRRPNEQGGRKEKSVKRNPFIRHHVQ